LDTYGRIERLLFENGMKQADLAKATGISTGLISQWKNRSQQPSAKKLQIIADYFGVSTDYLLGNEPKQKTPAEPGERTVSDEDIMFALFNGADDITDEMFEEVKRFAQFIQERERNKPD